MTIDQPGTGISLVVLAKDTRAAKTRLPLSRREARELARCLAAGTVRAGLEAATVGAVFVVTSDPDIALESGNAGARVVAEGGALGMNRAAALGRDTALLHRPDEPIAVVVADLPDLRSGDLDRVVRDFLAESRPTFVPDHLGTGTTFVIHGPEQRLGFGFGRRSADLHSRLGYWPADSSPRAMRWDLDTADDLMRTSSSEDAVVTA